MFFIFQEKLFAFWSDITSLDYAKIMLKEKCFLLLFIVQNTLANGFLKYLGEMKYGLEAFL